MGPRFVLFSGHNERAVIALCRFMQGQGLDLALVANGPDDAIWRTQWAHAVVFSRMDRQLDVNLFKALRSAVGPDAVLCPTTEFMNQFWLDHRSTLEDLGLRIALPQASVYATLTGKLSSQAVVARLCGLQPPPIQAKDHWHAPCVLKPIHNVGAGQVHYPRLCANPQALTEALVGLNPGEWFAQDWIDGQSHYLCAYLSRGGDRAWFWQDNLLQQPGGKSMVLARSGLNPGVDVPALLDGLQAMGYHGPLMLELIRDRQGRCHYIEINPRFWGPLQLALSACPRLLTLFARDWGATLPEPAPPAPGPHWYAWAKGAQEGNCRHYPAAAPLEPIGPGHPLLQRHDIYAAPDTQALHACH